MKTIENVTCSNCGETVEKVDADFINGVPYCDICFSEKNSYCDMCGNVTLTEELKEVCVKDDRIYICKGCFEYYYS